MTRLASVTLLLVCLGCAADDSSGRAPADVVAHLGTVAFPVSCATETQAAFDRAVALLHHMTYPAAREAFGQIAEADPQCAMAHWGVAMTLFQPLWPTRPGPDDLQRGWDELQTARRLGPLTSREHGYVEAAEAFFLDPASTDYWLRIRRWEAAMARLHDALPDDPEATALYALAHLATTPADAVDTSHAERAAALLAEVYAENPGHPGAMHYLVHASDVPGRERDRLETVHKYETVAPHNPHALHMPTHIYTRLGDWDGVVRGNTQAAEAALAHPAGDKGQFVWDEFPHAVEYLVYAFLQQGADQAAADQVARLLGTSALQPTFKTAFHIASVQARYALERQAWTEAARLVPREPPTLDWDAFMWPEAVSWFARGLGAAHGQALDETRRARTRLEALERAATSVGEDLFARNIRVLRLEVSAWLADAEGDRDASLALMREAVGLETATPKHAVTPAPTLPAHELLGDLLMKQDRPREALAAYRQSLDLYPHRFNSLLGAARAARATGDEAAARAFYQALLDEVASGATRPAVSEARDYLARESVSSPPWTPSA